jgi:hypothetical protein
MFKKFLIIIYVIIFAVVTYYVVMFFYDRETEDTETSIDRAKSRIEKMVNNENGESDKKSDQIDSTTDEESSQEEEAGVIDSTPAAYTITRDECDDECMNIDDSDKKKYCQQFCGLSGDPKDDHSCDSLSGLEKDYCIRDSAVAEQDFAKCKEVSDSGIREQCQKRIQEDIIDQIM